MSLPDGAQITSTIRKGEAGWNYVRDSENHGYNDNDTYIYDDYYYSDRVSVKASNGAERIYVIAYTQDESGTKISEISDAGNEYVHTQISEYTQTMYLTTEEGEETAPTSESVYMIFVKGNNQELGESYQLTLPEGSQTTVIHKGEAGWNS